jgi:hypothetical protein
VAPISSCWPPGKNAVVCFSIDDVHPGRSGDAFEAGGDLGAGALGHVEWLLARHPQLRVTLFVTPDWRETAGRPTMRLLASLPWLRDHVFLAPVLPAGSMRLDRHPGFVAYLRSLPRTEVALHGYQHVHRGRSIPVEFQEQSERECLAMLRAGRDIFTAAGLPPPAGLAPPGWNAPPALVAAAPKAGLSYLASARDVMTPVAPDAVTAMTGLRGVPLARPCVLAGGRLVHIPTNFQATSEPERAFQVLDSGGLLSIKAHIIKHSEGHVSLDGLDHAYRHYLHLLFRRIEERYGDRVWWATLAELAGSYLHATQGRDPA